MRIVVLGAAAGGGFPQWNCACCNCRRAWASDPAAPACTQSSLAVTADDERWILINAAPDLRQQILQTPDLHPHRRLRHSPIAALVVTNADVDHVGGLINLREGHPLALYASHRILQVLDGNPVFDVLDRNMVRRMALPLGESMNLADHDGDGMGIRAEVFPVAGKVALYLERPEAGADFGTVEGDTVGVRLEDERTGAAAYYIPNCAGMDDALASRLDGAALVFFDGTLYRDDELIAANLGNKTGRRMGHISVDGPEGSLAAFRKLDVSRKIYVHINNSNPLLLADSPERRRVEAAGWEVAYDGMEVVI